MNVKHPQSILAIDAAYLKTLGAVDGINTQIHFDEFFEGSGPHLVIRRRHELEANEAYLQILPYVVVAKGSIEDLKNLRLSAYYRPVSGGESRLHGNLSVGYGGHIDAKDVVFNEKSVLDFIETVDLSRGRELGEEIGLGNDIQEASQIHSYGLITDQSNSVGRVHLGVVYIFLVPEDWQPTAERSEVDLAGEFTAAELRAKHDAGEIVMESWTNLVINSLLA